MEKSWSSSFEERVVPVSPSPKANEHEKNAGQNACVTFHLKSTVGQLDTLAG
jgi:hypothetical protein